MRCAECFFVCPPWCYNITGFSGVCVFLLLPGWLLLSSWLVLHMSAPLFFFLERGSIYLLWSEFLSE